MRARAFIAAIAAAGVYVIATSAFEVAHGGVSPLLVMLILLTVTASLTALRMPSTAITLTIGDAFIAIAAIALGPAAGTITSAVDGLCVSLASPKTRRIPHRVLFNVASPPIAVWIGANAFAMLAGGDPATAGAFGAVRLLLLAATFASINFVVNTGLLTIVLHLQRGTPLFSMWWNSCLSLWLNYFAGGFAALLMLVLGRTVGLEHLVLIAPLPVVVYVTFRTAFARAADQVEHLGSVNRIYAASIAALAQAVDTSKGATHPRARLLQENAVRLARRVGITDDLELQAVRAAALLRDVGKIGIAEHILNKPAPLTAQEFEVVKRHAPVGADILSVIGFPYPVVPIVRHHHERWDGGGYPDSLSGEAIPLGARIMAVVDCYDAVTSDRPYRTRMTDAAALQIICERRGTAYDPQIVDALLAMQTSEVDRWEVDTTMAGECALPVATATPAVERRYDAPVLDGFFALGARIAETMRGQDVGGIVWGHLAPHVPATTFVLFVVDPESDSLTPLFRSDDRVLRGDLRISIGRRLSGSVAALGQTTISGDAHLDQDEVGALTHPLRSALIAPVIREGRPVAVLSLYADAPDAFNETHRRVVDAAARCIAVVPMQPSSTDVAAATAA